MIDRLLPSFVILVNSERLNPFSAFQQLLHFNSSLPLLHLDIVSVLLLTLLSSCFSSPTK